MSKEDIQDIVDKVADATAKSQKLMGAIDGHLDYITSMHSTDEIPQSVVEACYTKIQESVEDTCADWPELTNEAIRLATKLSAKIEQLEAELQKTKSKGTKKNDR